MDHKDGNGNILSSDYTGPLRTRTAHSSVITVITQGFVFILGLGSTIIMARLLTPKEFGLIAMANTLTALLRVFRDAGLSVATIQREGITHAQVSNLFWANLVVGTIVTLLVMLLSPAVGMFYKEPQLVQITLWISITFLCGSIAAQPRAMLQRQMRFKDLGLIDVGSTATSVIVGVVMAVMGFGVWALVGLQLSASIADLLLTIIRAKWYPQWPKSGIGTSGMLTFGASLTVASFLRQVAQSSDTILIGRVWGPVATGLYSRALVLLLRPVQQFLQPIESVFLPVLSRVQNEPERFKRIFLRSYRAIALISFPIAALLYSLGDLFVIVFLGPRWVGVIPIFKWLAVAALFIPISNAGMWILTTQGKSRQILLTGVLFSFLMVVSFAIGVHFGAIGVAIAYALGWLLLRLPIQNYIVGRVGLVSSYDLWKVMLTHLPICGIVAVVTALTRKLVEPVIRN